MPPSNLAPHPALLALLDNASWCWGGSVPLLPRPPTALDFHRKFVARNCPCVIRGLQDDWTKFGTFDELAEALGGLQRHVRVSATPTGRGDAVAMHGDGQKVFVKPDERTVPLAELRDFLYPLAPPAAGDVLYLSSQNDSLRQEFPALVDKGFAKNSLPFGDEAFGERALEAVNLWIGNERAVSTVHRDSTYENLYCVLSGCKVFHLMPPCVAPLLGEKEFPTCRYAKKPGQPWTVVEDPGAKPTPWVELDPGGDRQAACDIHPPFAHVPKELIHRVLVRPGECLYLPAGWWHRVSQTEPTVAVNYWYDREFDACWALQQAVEALVAEQLA